MPEMTNAKHLALALATLACTGASLPALAQDAPASSETVTVDWLEQMLAGGWTMVFLGFLSLAMVAFIVERALFLRRKRFCPPQLMDEVLPLIARSEWGKVLATAEKRPSTMSKIVAFMVTHRSNPYDKLSSVVADIGSRDIVDQEERTYPLAVIAGVAPLLGLLGTMIGMIEAFQLVSIYGDEGGASMLAGSIAKALITTATGLVLAIPALIGYHYFRRKVHGIAVELDTQTERLLTTCFFRRSSVSDSNGDGQPPAKAVRQAADSVDAKRAERPADPAQPTSPDDSATAPATPRR